MSVHENKKIRIYYILLLLINWVNKICWFFNFFFIKLKRLLFYIIVSSLFKLLDRLAIETYLIGSAGWLYQIWCQLVERATNLPRTLISCWRLSMNRTSKFRDFNLNSEVILMVVFLLNSSKESKIITTRESLKWFKNFNLEPEWSPLKRKFEPLHFGY